MSRKKKIPKTVKKNINRSFGLNSIDMKKKSIKIISYNECTEKKSKIISKEKKISSRIINKNKVSYVNEIDVKTNELSDIIQQKKVPLNRSFKEVRDIKNEVVIKKENKNNKVLKSVENKLSTLQKEEKDVDVVNLLFNNVIENRNFNNVDLEKTQFSTSQTRDDDKIEQESTNDDKQDIERYESLAEIQKTDI
ncbi:Hypothetical protein SRAE_2000006700 [Strongyloides ratti]|uniref:Uncharacterized protein n=1 Tax=Strongyloides ratti TaxID=34506 RepID=A0A090L6F8_STRRB|nr:Hypothetical protein SRAE_2000006700 [Strongyloides ratti]CEF65386.1 Hypothetical protein SRAE_2000006700 [Strongyloides ratti]